MAADTLVLVQKPFGGDMNWKKAVFLGGAVLLLAACDRATAPNALVREGGPAAAAKAPTSPKHPRTDSGLDGGCEGYFVREGGRDSTCLVEAP
jgi:hypothetical protein